MHSLFVFDPVVSPNIPLPDSENKLTPCLNPKKEKVTPRIEQVAPPPFTSVPQQ